LEGFSPQGRSAAQPWKARAAPGGSARTAATPKLSWKLKQCFVTGYTALNPRPPIANIALQICQQNTNHKTPITIH